MHFAGKTGLFIYIWSYPFSDNSKVTDLVIVYKGSKISPKHSNGVYVWCFVERQMHCILQVVRGKEANILQVLCQ